MLVEICKYSDKDSKLRRKYKRLHKDGKVKLVDSNKYCFVYEDTRRKCK